MADRNFLLRSHARITTERLRAPPSAAPRVAEDQRVERGYHRRGFLVRLAADADQGEGDGGGAYDAAGGADCAIAGVDAVTAKDVGEDVGAELGGQGEKTRARVVLGVGGMLVTFEDEGGRGDLHWEEVVGRVGQRDETVGEDLDSVGLRHCCGMAGWKVWRRVDELEEDEYVGCQGRD